MSSMVTTADRVRSIAVLVFAVAQLASAPVTFLVQGEAGNQGAISDANLSPVTPAGYAFSIWGLIYAASLVLAIYQLLPGQLAREVHRRTGWWLVSAFAASTVWVPVFGTRVIWASQVVIVALVVFLVLATVLFTELGRAETVAEQFAFRLPVTLYLGWATLACFAGFGTTFRSLGLPQESGLTRLVGVALVVGATVVSLFVIGRLSALAGFVFTAGWALVAVAVATYADPVRWTTLLALVVLVGVLVARTARSTEKTRILLG
jgi:hypothetical protein